MEYIRGNKFIFVCRLGHISNQAKGSPGYYQCVKLVQDIPCRKKVEIMRREFVRSLFSRGWKARESNKPEHVCDPFEGLMNTLVTVINYADREQDLATKA